MDLHKLIVTSQLDNPVDNEIPEIDSTVYWTDTSSCVLEITRGDLHDEVIIPLSNVQSGLKSRRAALY